MEMNADPQTIDGKQGGRMMGGGLIFHTIFSCAFAYWPDISRFSKYLPEFQLTKARRGFRCGPGKA